MRHLLVLVGGVSGGVLDGGVGVGVLEAVHNIDAAALHGVITVNGRVRPRPRAARGHAPLVARYPGGVAVTVGGEEGRGGRRGAAGGGRRRMGVADGRGGVAGSGGGVGIEGS